MKIVFHADAWNDVDHMAPIMLAQLNRRMTVQMGVRLVQLTPGAPIEHPMLPVLRGYSRFEYIRPTRLQYLRQRLLFRNRIVRKWIVGSSFLAALRSVLLARWPNSMLETCDFCVYGWGSPKRLNAEEALHLGIPVVCVPHGYNIFTNYDVNPHVHSIFVKTGKWPDFSERNAFTKYIVNSEQSRKHMVDWGVHPEIVENYGSARFDPAYASFLTKVSDVYEFPEIDGTTKNIAFFLPHLGYNVILDDLLALIEALVQDPSINLVVRQHTRKSRSAPRSAHFLDTLIGISIKLPNLHIERQAHSASIVKGADAVITFGSSIAIEALLQQIPVIYPNYLDTNTTIFDDGEIVNVATSQTAALKLVSLVGDRDVTLVAQPRSLDEFLNAYIYGCNSVASIGEDYIVRMGELYNQRRRHPR